MARRDVRSTWIISFILEAFLISRVMHVDDAPMLRRCLPQLFHQKTCKNMILAMVLQSSEGKSSSASHYFCKTPGQDALFRIRDFRRLTFEGTKKRTALGPEPLWQRKVPFSADSWKMCDFESVAFLHRRQWGLSDCDFRKSCKKMCFCKFTHFPFLGVCCARSAIPIPNARGISVVFLPTQFSPMNLHVQVFLQLFSYTKIVDFHWVL